MDKPRVYIDFNEMVTDDIVLLSKEDTKVDSEGNIVVFYDKMPVLLYSDDASDNGETDNLLAEGIAIKYDLKGYPGWEHVKWCARVDWDSLIHESDLEFMQLLLAEIKRHPDDIQLLRECLVKFKNRGMGKAAMLKNLEKLREAGGNNETYGNNERRSFSIENRFSNGENSFIENVVLDLMDFVSGWCEPSLSVFG